MAISTANFCRETSGTGGTGTYNLGGATGRYQTFVDAVGTGSKVYYHAFDDQDFESGIGTVTDASPDTLSRDTILESSNSDAAVDWPASGQRTIVMTAPAQKTVLEDENGKASVTGDFDVGGGGGSAATLGSNASGELTVNGTKITGKERVLVQTTSSKTIPSGASTAISWDSEQYDVGGLWSSGTNIIMPRAGTVVAVARVGWDTPDTTKITTTITKNDSTVIGLPTDDRESFGGPFVSVSSAPIVVAQNDELEVKVTQNSGSSDTVSSCWFSVYYIE